MEVTVEHLGGVQFEIRAREHTIVSDQPAANAGFDEGMTPPELLLGSLGSCAAYYAVEYLRRHGLADTGTRVRITAEKSKQPARLSRFVLEIAVPVALSPAEEHAMHEAVRRCLIHNTLVHPPAIEIALTQQVPAGS